MTSSLPTAPPPEAGRARPNRRRWLAAVLAAVLAVGGSLSAAVPAFADGAPSVTVTEAPVEGGTVTITGTGFRGDATGIYVGVGEASAAGFYSAGISESGTVWVAIGLETTATRAPMSADGSFSLDLVVPAAGETGLAVFTSRAHGGGMMGDLTQDTTTAVVYAAAPEEPGTGEPGTGEPGTGEPGTEEPGTGEPGTEEPGTEEPGTEEPGTEEPGTEEPSEPAKPVLSLSKSVGLAAEGETVTVTGRNYNPAQAMYLTLCTDVPLESVSFSFISAGCTAGAKQVSPNPTTSTQVKLEADGSFTTQFLVTSKGASTAVYTIANHTAMQDRGQDAKVAVTFAAPTPVIDPELTVTPSTGVDPTVSNTFEISGTGYVGAGAKSGAYVLIGEAGVWNGTGPLPSTGWLVQGWVMPQQIVDGAFTAKLTVPAGSFDPSKTYVAASSAAHALSITDRSLDAFAPIAIAEPLPTGPRLTVTPSEDIDGTVANTFTISGTGYVGAGAASGAYVLLGQDDIWSGDGPLVSDGWLAQGWVMPQQIVNGAFTTTLTVAAGKFDAKKGYVVASSAAHGLSVVDRSLDAFVPITVASGAVEPGGPVTPPVGPSKPTTPTTPPVVTPTPVVAGGSLSWGVSERFVDYVVGSIAKGSVTVSGATRSGGAFQFGQAGGTYDARTGRGTADYSGSVNFRGHGGVLDLTFTDPVLRVVSSTSGVLSVAVNGSRVDLASVDLGAAAKSTANGTTRFANAPVTLLAAGASAFNGFYGAGEALAPLTAVIGSPAAAPAGDSGTVVTAAAVSRSTARDIPSAPPATTGIVLDTATLEALGAGEVVSVTAGGFQSGEAGIAAVVYSTPIVLADDLSADAAGNVTWTGSIPASLEPGVHTLTFQGSTDVGVQFTVPAEKAGVCKVSAGDLDWGFKESFRSYLTSGIANGDWTVAGVTEEGGVFAFTGASGSLGQSGRGVVVYPGTVEFTGHDGELDTTISNPKIELDGEGGAILLLDVAGTTQDGEPIDLKSVRFAELELADGVTLSGGVLAGEATAVLTEDGSAAFGTYPAGEQLDPVSFTATVSGDCVATAATAEEANEVEEAEATSDGDSAAAAAETSQAGPAWWVWALIAALVAILLAVIAVVVLRARRSAEQG
ncbi:hypothetical protein BJ978_001341 [Agromyces terreus]|uniref:Htaa domain-containing protein n=1 Tax=Agromyces terreus TaxID=424795 RepID=A0A9X2GX22_9MICO|nr:HtaA domain-containing protein [Agromyces terreus]MCP2370665.1 hypothetical protein [Agromyces terreus]